MVIQLCRGKRETPPPFHLGACISKSKDEIVSEIPHNPDVFQEKFKGKIQRMHVRSDQQKGMKMLLSRTALRPADQSRGAKL